MKIKKKILLFFCFVSNVSFLFAQIPTNGLIASYPFNGNAIDASVNGRI